MFHPKLTSSISTVVKTMQTHIEPEASKPTWTFSRFLRKISPPKQGLAIKLTLFALIPLCVSFAIPLESKGTYFSIVSAINLVAAMLFYLQFPLAGKIRQLKPFSNIDWSMSKHKTIGQWIGVIFLAHPFLILAPKLLQSNGDAYNALITALTNPQLLTGIVAWVTMFIWILMSVFKEKLPLKYQHWRLTHSIGFIIISVLVTLHITQVGSHGQFSQQFNGMWWALCSLSIIGVIYNLILKPQRLAAKPFSLKSVDKISDSDWLMTVTTKQADTFAFEAGQFVWLSTHKSASDIDYHPFSIASSRRELPNVSFIIRELGDYTKTLHTLTVGQNVYIDGPYGSMNLSDCRDAKGITLIAGGAGIGPMLGLLKELAATNDTRPVRLIYGNNSYSQMTMQNEILGLQETMLDFKQLLVCQEPTSNEDVHFGVIDKQCIEQTIPNKDSEQWAIYMCGPSGMISAVSKHLKAHGVTKSNIHFEQLSF